MAAKTVDKWFVMSRGLWGGVIPILVSAAKGYGLSTDGLDHDLSDFFDLILLSVAGGLALWSRFRPDNAQLTVVPETVPAK